MILMRQTNALHTRIHAVHLNNLFKPPKNIPVTFHVYIFLIKYTIGISQLYTSLNALLVCLQTSIGSAGVTLNASIRGLSENRIQAGGLLFIQVAF